MYAKLLKQLLTTKHKITLSLKCTKDDLDLKIALIETLRVVENKIKEILPYSV